MIEEWKLYKDSTYCITKNGVFKKTSHGGLWEISSFGRVKKNGVFVDLKLNNSGYLTCALGLVHRMVAEVFIDNPYNKKYVDHIDTDKLNNKADNLRWVTQSENSLNYLTSAKRKGQKRTLEQRKRIAEATSKAEKGRKWYNDGIKSYFIYPKDKKPFYKEGRPYHKRRKKGGYLSENGMDIEIV